MYNAEIVEIIWKRVSNSELSQYLTALKVKFQHQTRNYREVLQYIASQVLSIDVETSQKASECQYREHNQEEPHIRAFMTVTCCYFMAHTLRKTGSVVQSNLTGKISVEIVMHPIAIEIALRPNTGVVLIKKNGTKRSMKSQR